MNYKLWIALVSLIPLSSFACEPTSPMLKKIKIADRETLKSRLNHFGGIGWTILKNEDFMKALAEQEITKDAARDIVTKFVDNDIAKNPESKPREIAPGVVIVTNNLARIARECWIDHLTRVVCDEYERYADTGHLSPLYPHYLYY